MVDNPLRSWSGGDVEGTTKTDAEWSVGDAVTVAKASFDPGYDLGHSIGYCSEADLTVGYCSYGIAVGDARPKGMIGGGGGGKAL